MLREPAPGSGRCRRPTFPPSPRSRVTVLPPLRPSSIHVHRLRAVGDKDLQEGRWSHAGVGSSPGPCDGPELARASAITEAEAGRCPGVPGPTRCRQWSPLAAEWCVSRFHTGGRGGDPAPALRCVGGCGFVAREQQDLSCVGMRCVADQLQLQHVAGDLVHMRAEIGSALPGVDLHHDLRSLTKTVGLACASVTDVHRRVGENATGCPSSLSSCAASASRAGCWAAC